MSEKTKTELLREKLCYVPKNAFRTLSADDIAAADTYCEAYKDFLNHAKTEREAVEETISYISKHQNAMG